MKTVVLLFVLSLFVSSSMAQEINETLDKKSRKKYEKLDKKKQKEEEMLKAKEELNVLLEGKAYVLEANNLSGRSGAMVPVTSTLNFFAVDSTIATIQVGSITGLGYNGVGGITDDAKITRYEKKDAKAGYSVKIYASSSLTSYTIFLNVNGSMTATARVSGLSGGMINFHGRIVPISESIVFKGRTTF